MSVLMKEYSFIYLNNELRKLQRMQFLKGVLGLFVNFTC